MKASYSQKPEALELMTDGYHKFRFDIVEQTTNEQTQWLCNEVDIHGAVSSQKVIESVIAEKWGNGVEQKLINDYNEFALGVGSENAKVAYETFLAERKLLKEYVHGIVG